MLSNLQIFKEVVQPQLDRKSNMLSNCFFQSFSLVFGIQSMFLYVQCFFVGLLLEYPARTDDKRAGAQGHY